MQDAPSLGPWIQRYVDFTSPGTYYAAGGGSMGWGFPAAMGMQLARPQDRIVTVSGDGSFWMVPSPACSVRTVSECRRTPS